MTCLRITATTIKKHTNNYLPTFLLVIARYGSHSQTNEDYLCTICHVCCTDVLSTMYNQTWQKNVTNKRYTSRLSHKSSHSCPTNAAERQTDRQTDQRLAGIICTMQVLDTDSSVRARRVLISQEKNLISKIKNLKN